MTREIKASQLSIGLIAAIRASGIEKITFSREVIRFGAEAVIKKLEKNEITLDDKFKFKDGFESIGFGYALLDLGTSGTLYIQLSEKGAVDYFNHCVKGEDLDFFKQLAKRFLNRASRYEKREWNFYNRTVM